MFKREVKNLDDIISKALHDMHLDTPLNEKRLIDLWEDIAGPAVSRYTGNKFIRNQVLFVEINNPSLKANLMMMRSKLTDKLNNAAGLRIITDIKFY